MNDKSWVNDIPRAKALGKYAFVGIHVLAPFRDVNGVAPVVLQTKDEYLRAPAYMEAAFELSLRHLHRISVPWPYSAAEVTPQTLLSNRAMEALKLPGKYVPTAEGEVAVMTPEISLPPPTSLPEPPEIPSPEQVYADPPEIPLPEQVYADLPEARSEIPQASMLSKKARRRAAQKARKALMRGK
jgi:hypothetical protein